MPVHGQGIELDQSIFRAAGKKLKASDLVFISFENEAAALQSRVTQLHLSSEILGTTRDQNGAYPVALLGAQLLKGNPGLPKRVLLQRGRQFRLNVTPAYGDMPILGKLIAAYQSRAVHRSA